MHATGFRLLTPLTAALMAAGLAVVTATATAQAAPIRQAAGSDCNIETSSVASPNVLLLGESTTVRLRVRGNCPGEAPPLHIVLVIDGSGTMQGERSRQLRDSAEALIQGLRLAEHPKTQAGVVSFQSVASTLCGLTNDERFLVGCVRRLGSSGGSSIDRGIIEGLKVLLMGRPAPDAVQPLDVMVLVTDGGNITGCPPLQGAALKTKAAGIQLLVACISRACDDACLRGCASTEAQVYRLDHPGQLAERLTAPLAALSGIPLRLLTIVETLAPGMSLLPGSAAPAALLSPDGRTLTWTVALPNAVGTEVSYRLRPQDAGYHAISQGASATYADAQGRAGQSPFPVPKVSVFRLGTMGMGDGRGGDAKRHRPVNPMARSW